MKKLNHSDYQGGSSTGTRSSSATRIYGKTSSPAALNSNNNTSTPIRRASSTSLRSNNYQSQQNTTTEILSAQAITSLAENFKSKQVVPSASPPPRNAFDDEIEDRLIQLEKMAKELYNEKPPIERFSKHFVEMAQFMDREMDTRVLKIESLDTNISMLKNEVSYTNNLVERFARGLERCLEKHPLMIPENAAVRRNKNRVMIEKKCSVATLEEQ